MRIATWTLFAAAAGGIAGVSMPARPADVSSPEAAWAVAGPRAPEPAALRRAEGFRAAPRFIENRGQFARPDAVLYAQSPDVEIAFVPGAVLFHHIRWERDGERPVQAGGELVEMRIGRPDARPEPTGPLASRSHFLFGPDESGWVTGVRHFEGVHYRDVRPGVDLDWSFDDHGRLVYEFTVRPGADPRAVELAFEGALRLEPQGPSAIDVVSGDARIHDGGLVCFQVAGDVRNVVESSFRRTGERSYGIELPRGYDATLPLVIDPTLEFSSYWGAAANSQNRTVAIDDAGGIYLSGGTYSAAWPTTAGAYDRTFAGNGWPDVAVAKFDSSGDLVWSTLAGGSEEDYCYVSAVNGAGELYLGGRAGTGYPTTVGAYDRTFNGGVREGSAHSAVDAFVTRLKSDGSGLLYSTYIGGSQNDGARGIHLLPDGRVIVSCGNSLSTNVPVTPGAYKSTHGGLKDVFLAEVAADGRSLGFLTYFGPNDDNSVSQDEDIRSIAVDLQGNIWMGGVTSGKGLTPTSNAFQKQRGVGSGTTESFIAKLSPDGSQLRYLSWFGGSGSEAIETEGVNDAAGNFYVAGSTTSSDFPFTPGAFRGGASSTGGSNRDAFVARIDADGSLGMCAAYGGTTSGNENGFGPAVDAQGNVYLTGRVLSTNCSVTADALQRNKASGSNLDAFLAVFSADGTQLLYGSYLGGNGDEDGRYLAIDPAGQFVVLAGETASTNFPLASAYQTSVGGVYYAKFDVSDLTTPPVGSPGAVRFASSAPTVGEAAGVATISVDRTGGSAGAVSARFQVAAGSASAGSDFVAATGNVQFADGQTQTAFDVVIREDTRSESNETIRLTLSQPTGGATIGGSGQSTLTIVDNDRARSDSPLILPHRVIVGPSRRSPLSRRVVVTGTLDRGPDDFDLDVPSALTIGGVPFAVPALPRRARGYRYRGAALKFLARPSRRGSSRVAMRAIAESDQLTVVDVAGDVVVAFDRGEFHAECTVRLVGGRYRTDGRTGMRLAPPAAPVAMSAVARGSARDVLRMKLAVPSGQSPAPDVSIRFAEWSVDAPGALFSERRGIRKFTLGVPAVRITVDDRRGVLTLRVRNVDLGIPDDTAGLVRVEVTYGTSHAFDVVVARRGRRVTY